MFFISTKLKYTFPCGELTITTSDRKVKNILIRTFKEFTGKEEMTEPALPISAIRRLPYALMDLAHITGLPWELNLMHMELRDKDEDIINVVCDHLVIASFTLRCNELRTYERYHDFDVGNYHTTIWRILAHPYKGKYTPMCLPDGLKIMSHQGKGIVHLSAEIMAGPPSKDAEQTPHFLTLTYTPIRATLRETWELWKLRWERFTKHVPNNVTNIVYCYKYGERDNNT